MVALQTGYTSQGGTKLNLVNFDLPIGKELILLYSYRHFGPSKLIRVDPSRSELNRTRSESIRVDPTRITDPSEPIRIKRHFETWKYWVYIFVFRLLWQYCCNLIGQLSAVDKSTDEAAAARVNVSRNVSRPDRIVLFDVHIVVKSK